MWVSHGTSLYPRSCPGSHLALGPDCSVHLPGTQGLGAGVACRARSGLSLGQLQLGLSLPEVSLDPRGINYQLAASLTKEPPQGFLG